MALCVALALLSLALVGFCNGAPVNQTYQIGQMPIECTTWLDCYSTREPLLAVGSEWRYTSKGCACEHDEAYGELNLFCGIERRRTNELKLEMVPCVYCGAECNTPDFYQRNAEALVAWQDRRTARFRPVSAGAEQPAANAAGAPLLGQGTEAAKDSNGEMKIGKASVQQMLQMVLSAKKLMEDIEATMRSLVVA